MYYLSKGVFIHQVETLIQVSHRGTVHSLIGESSSLWLSGQRGPRLVVKRTKCFDALVELGLVETTEETAELARYRLLTNCIICPIKPYDRSCKPKTAQDQAVLKWIRHAGLRLTVAELIYLAEKQVRPKTSILGKRNRQVLVETIYTTGNIADMVLETQMEHAQCRDHVVNAIYRLLNDNFIYLI